MGSTYLDDRGSTASCHVALTSWKIVGIHLSFVYTAGEVFWFFQKEENNRLLFTSATFELSPLFPWSDDNFLYLIDECSFEDFIANAFFHISVNASTVLFFQCLIDVVSNNKCHAGYFRRDDPFDHWLWMNGKGYFFLKDCTDQIGQLF